MENIQYIMATQWALHWDKLEAKWGNSTLFTEVMIKDGLTKGPWIENAITLFIKRDYDIKAFEKSWIGRTKNFKRGYYNDKPCVRFDVSDLSEYACPPEFINLPSGWYLNKTNASVNISSKSDLDSGFQLQPVFFKEMETCDSITFELNCYYLLRLLGIHDIHKFPQHDNRGKADGFFRFNSLVVIYDATLESNYLQKKETQIENYVSQLKKERIEFNTNIYSIKDTQRQVWVITRNKEIRLLRIDDNIKIKEIPFTRLIDVYSMRLDKEIGVEELWDVLKDLS